MATDDADQSDSGQPDGSESAESGADDGDSLPRRSESDDVPPPDETADADGDDEAGADGEAAESESPEPSPGVGEYTWREFVREYGREDEASSLYADVAEDDGGLLGGGSGASVPSGEDWERIEFDPEEYLGFHPDDVGAEVEDAAGVAKGLQDFFREFVDPEMAAVVKDEYGWEHFKREYFYNEDGSRPRTADGDVEEFEPERHLGFDPDDVEGVLSNAGNVGSELDEVVDRRTVDVQDDVDEDAFFSSLEGHTTVVNRYDLEKAVPMSKKLHFREEDRYWVNEPYAFVIIFHSEKENEKKYYLVEPYLDEIEVDLREFLAGKLRTAIKYSDDEIVVEGSDGDRAQVIERETHRLLQRYDLYASDDDGVGESKGIVEQIRDLLAQEDREQGDDGELEGLSVRPEPERLDDDPETLTEYQVDKLLYLLKRDFIGYERIDGIKHDINVEDVSCDGYDSPVFVYHSEYEQIISNVYHGRENLDEFVVKLAQRSGKGISKRRPQVDATLPDGSRAQLTLGKEVSDHGTNYTIRQFKDVPFTPLDLISWNTFSLDEMAFLWLCIENHKSLIFAGGTASGKTTSLNAISLFIPSNSKIVSIEDTREVELPQRNWIASVTRPSFSDDDQGDVDEFDLLEAALRQRPDYIVMGEIRGEEGRTLFQVMSTGHTTYTTFHADSVGEVLKRFTTDPINVSKTMFTALDLVSIQTQTRVQGRKVRRNKELTEINHYDAENDEINVQDVYQWQAETDEFLKMGESNTLDEIKFDRGWSQTKLDEELFKRRIILAYLIKNGLNEYAQVAATAQAFINDPETILTLIANDQLEESLEDLREMESVLIDVDPEKEELVPRPDPDDETYDLTVDILEKAEESLLEELKGRTPEGLSSVLGSMSEEESIEATPGRPAFEDDVEFEGELMENDVEPGAFDIGTDTEIEVDDEDEVDDEERDVPAWLVESDEGSPIFVDPSALARGTAEGGERGALPAAPYRSAGPEDAASENGGRAAGSPAASNESTADASTGDATDERAPANAASASSEDDGGFVFGDATERDAEPAADGTPSDTAGVAEEGGFVFGGADDDDDDDDDGFFADDGSFFDDDDFFGEGGFFGGEDESDGDDEAADERDDADESDDEDQDVSFESRPEDDAGSDEGVTVEGEVDE